MDAKVSMEYPFMNSVLPNETFIFNMSYADMCILQHNNMTSSIHTRRCDTIANITHDGLTRIVQYCLYMCGSYNSVCSDIHALWRGASARATHYHWQWYLEYLLTAMNLLLLLLSLMVNTYQCCCKIEHVPHASRVCNYWSWFWWSTFNTDKLIV